MWPDNWPAWCLFWELRGQWRTRGVDGQIYALDYGVLFARMDRMSLPDDAWQQRYDDVRWLEAAAVEQMRAA